MFFAGLALAGWGWAILDGSYQRDIAASASGEGRWIVLAVAGLVMLAVGTGMTLMATVNWLYAHLRIV